jgi:hypothetical protein
VTEYHQGFIAGYMPGFLMGLGLMKMAWDHSERQRRRRQPKQPEQPLAADLIRYSRWRNEQIERALLNQPPTENPSQQP